MPTALRHTLKKALKHERELRAGIASAGAEGSSRRAENAQRLYLDSFDSKIVAACRAGKSFPLHLRPQPTSMVRAARETNVWRLCGERVMLRLEEKKTPGTYRLIYDFGVENRTRQHLVAECLKPRVALHPRQYASAGGGTHAAVKAVSEAIEAGSRYVAHADINNFYSSVSPEKLAGVLPLPKRLIETVVLAKAYRLWPGWVEDQESLHQEVNKLNTDLASHLEDLHLLHTSVTDEFPPDFDEALGGYLAEGRLGIPAGSPVSSVVAEALLAPVVEQISNCGVFAQYADDCMVLDTSKEGVELTLQTLRSALKSHPAGPFSVKEKAYKLGEPFDFLGFRLTPHSGHVVITPTKQNLLKFGRSFEWRRKQILRVQSEPQRDVLVKRLRVFVTAWSSAFSLWDGADTHRDEHLALVKELVKATECIT